MKCDICGQPAVIGMPQHRLTLCEEHYLAWVHRTVQRAIEKHGLFTRDERILLAVSGGKDSLALWQILLDLGYRVEGLHIHLGITDEGYSDASQERVRAFSEAHGGVPWQAVNLAEVYGTSIPELAERHRARRPCSSCGTVKRHIMNRAACDGGYDALATGHNLDDEAAALMQNTLRWKGGYLRRQAPLLPGNPPGLARKVKPLCTLYERETAAYALLRGIDYVEDECPYAVGAKTILYKELLNRLETRSRGAKLQFYLEFLHAREDGLFSAEEPGRRPLKPCTRCGQLTAGHTLCSFCRLMERPQ